MALADLLGQIPSVYKTKNNVAAITAATTSAISRPKGVRVGLLRRGVQVGFGVGKFRIGRIIVFSYFVFRQWTPRIAGLAGFCPRERPYQYWVTPPFESVLAVLGSSREQCAPCSL
jgi:hypothetical protein